MLKLAEKPVKDWFFTVIADCNISHVFRKILNLHHAIQSLSALGQPHDNAVAESFFASMKKEALYRKDCKYKTELPSTVKEYIRFYNNERPDSALGYKTPVQFEKHFLRELSEEQLTWGVRMWNFWSFDKRF
jgi:transposase InsO family protein